jgi:hypothetical protein
MPSLIGSDVAGNYRQQQVPFSRFGTRKIAFYKISHADTQQSGGVLDLTLMNTLVDTIQTRMELVMVGAPKISNNWGRFIIAVFEDTANDGSNIDLDNTPQLTNDKATTLADALQAATGDGNITVDRLYMYGAPASDEAGYGWEFDDTYREYDYKGEYVNDSYVF